MTHIAEVALDLDWTPMDRADFVAKAMDFQKRPTDVPLDTDLFGPGKYLPQKPACPSGGVYTLGAVQAKPTCSVPGHVNQ